jgi:hypothetical protein
MTQLPAGPLVLQLTMIEEAARAARVNLCQATTLADAAKEPQNALHLAGGGTPATTPATQYQSMSNQHAQQAVGAIHAMLQGAGKVHALIGGQADQESN